MLWLYKKFNQTSLQPNFVQTSEICGFVKAKWTQQWEDLRFSDFKKSLHAHLWKWHGQRIVYTKNIKKTYVTTCDDFFITPLPVKTLQNYIHHCTWFKISVYSRIFISFEVESVNSSLDPTLFLDYDALGPVAKLVSWIKYPVKSYWSKN
jgi:hypothetical protein